jgi:hypothetical protein
MKNLLENFALLIVALLSITIIFFIVQYNLIEDEDSTEVLLFEEKVTSKKVKTKNYLDALEGYGDDSDVKVDSEKENNTNTLEVESELREDALDIVIDDKSKSAYMENLSNYSETEVKSKVTEKDSKPQKHSPNPSGEPKKLKYDKVVDEVGMAIDALDL